GREALELDKIESARDLGNRQVEVDEPNEQDEAPETQVDGNLPRGGKALPAPPQPDEQEGRDEGQFVKGVEEEQVHRGKGARRPGGNEQQARVEEAFPLL